MYETYLNCGYCLWILSVERSTAESCLDVALSSDTRETELVLAIKSDFMSQQCRDFLTDGWPPSGVHLCGEIASLCHNPAKLTIFKYLILFGARFYILLCLHGIYLKRVREGHRGVGRCRSRAAKLFWWAGVCDEIGSYVSKCEECIKNARVKHQPLVNPAIPGGPWQEINVDLFIFRDDLYIILADYYSRWIEAIRTPSQEATVVVTAMKNVVSRLGVPSVVRSDNTPCFCAAEFRSFVGNWGFKHALSSSSYPQSNSLVERGVGAVKNMLTRENPVIRMVHYW